MSFTRPIDQVLSIDSLKRCAEALNNHFFTPGAMRFFNSRIGENLYSVSDSIGFFTTSEKNEDNPRHYSVRRFYFSKRTDEEGGTRETLNIDRIAIYQTAAEARRAAEKFAQKERETGETTPEQD